MCMWMDACVCMCMHVHACIHTCIHTCAHNGCMQVDACVCMCMRMHAWIHACIHTCAHDGCMHVCIHTCIHTCIHACRATAHKWMHACVDDGIYAAHACTSIDVMQRKLLTMDACMSVLMSMHMHACIHACMRAWLACMQSNCPQLDACMCGWWHHACTYIDVMQGELLAVDACMSIYMWRCAWCIYICMHMPEQISCRVTRQHARVYVCVHRMNHMRAANAIKKWFENSRLINRQRYVSNPNRCHVE
jgi:hypothetical protein